MILQADCLIVSKEKKHLTLTDSGKVENVPLKHRILSFYTGITSDRLSKSLGFSSMIKKFGLFLMKTNSIDL